MDTPQNCPCCSSTAHVSERPNEFDSMLTVYQVRCTYGCQMRGPDKATRRGAVEEWDRVCDSVDLARTVGRMAGEVRDVG